MDAAIFKHLMENYVPQTAGGVFIMMVIAGYLVNKKLNTHSARIKVQEEINHMQEVAITKISSDIEGLKNGQERQMKLLTDINNHLLSKG